MSTLAAALHYLSLRFNILPLAKGDKAPVAGYTDWPKRPRMSAKEARRWFGREDHNLGVMTGPCSGIWVLDADDMASVAEVERRLGGLRVPTVGTTRGRHYYFACPPGVDLRCGRVVGMKADIKGRGGYVVAPPSVGKTGHVYHWLHSLKDTCLQEAPSQVLALVPGQGGRAVGAAAEGGRNDAIFELALRLRDTGIGIDDAWPRIEAFARGECVPPYPLDEARKTLRSAYSRPRRGARVGESTKGKGDDDRTGRVLLDEARRLDAFLDTHGTPCVALHGRACVVGEQDLMHHLTLHFHSATEQVPGSEAFERAFRLLRARAAKVPRREVYNRVASQDETSATIDLGRDDGACIFVSPVEWRVGREPKVLFRRYAHQHELPMPVRGGDPWLLFDFLNVEDRDHKVLLLVWLCSALLSHFPRCLLMLQGDPGAAKTTAARIMRSLVDPSALNGIPVPAKDCELAQVLMHNWLPIFDNVDRLKPNADLISRK